MKTQDISLQPASGQNCSPMPDKPFGRLNARYWGSWRQLEKKEVILSKELHFSIVSINIPFLLFAEMTKNNYLNIRAAKNIKAWAWWVKWSAHIAHFKATFSHINTKACQMRYSKANRGDFCHQHSRHEILLVWFCGHCANCKKHHCCVQRECWRSECRRATSYICSRCVQLGALAANVCTTLKKCSTEGHVPIELPVFEWVCMQTAPHIRRARCLHANFAPSLRTSSLPRSQGWRIYTPHFCILRTHKRQYRVAKNWRRRVSSGLRLVKNGRELKWSGIIIQKLPQAEQILGHWTPYKTICTYNLNIHHTEFIKSGSLG